ncbi:MAG TPA: hypothetical protein VKY73_22270 [Polyangiaceae bacterium]|nr:hypothetical protein [Polyangiaceae bacterium]
MRLLRSIVAPAVIAAFSTLSFDAHALEAPPDPTGKGIAGGALLGAELVLAIEAAFDVEPTWAYVVGGLVGAGGGAVGGYFVEEEADPRIPMFMLAGGMALAIPTMVAVLSATAYEAPEGPVGSGSSPALVGVDAERVSLGVPALELRDVYSRFEVAAYGAQQATEVRVPVLNVLF